MRFRKPTTESQQLKASNSYTQIPKLFHVYICDGRLACYIIIIWQLWWQANSLSPIGEQCQNNFSKIAKQLLILIDSLFSSYHFLHFFFTLFASPTLLAMTSGKKKNSTGTVATVPTRCISLLSSIMKPLPQRNMPNGLYYITVADHVDDPYFQPLKKLFLVEQTDNQH